MLIWAEVSSQWGDSCILLWINWCFNKHYQSHTQGLFNPSVLWVWGRNKVLYLWFLTPLSAVASIACSSAGWVYGKEGHTQASMNQDCCCVQVWKELCRWRRLISSESKPVLYSRKRVDYWRMNNNRTTKRVWRCKWIVWFCMILLFSHFLWGLGWGVYVCGICSISARKQTQGKTDCKMQWLLMQGKLSRHPEDSDPSSSYPKEGYTGKGISGGIQTECKLVTGTV